ncbi:MAG: nucleotidyltransferase domain-containing protein [Chloroflexota bacterium]|nr:nucleotidyltransferase domain-containing protein [Chloroflexota bacterium]
MFRDMNIEPLLTIITDWGRAHADVRAIALVGSYARGTARPDSDVDVMILSAAPDRYRSADWLTQIDWAQAAVTVVHWHDKDYGVVWSRHVELGSGLQVEFSFGAPGWASVDPLDAGTARVLGDGYHILYDADGLLARVASMVNTK